MPRPNTCSNRWRHSTPDSSDSPHLGGAPLPRIGDADGEKSSSPAESVSDPMPGIAESGAADSQMR